MRKIPFVAVAFALVSASAEMVGPVRLPSDIVVTDFGAKGDGLTDDTTALQIMDLLGVPTVFSRYPKRSMRDPSRKPVAFRWVDNYGSYLSRGMRYGGEWGGLTPVYHYGGAHTRIEGGHMAYTTTSTYTTPLLADSPEPDAALFAVSLPAYCKIYRKLAMQWRPALDAEPVPVQKERIDVCCPSVNSPQDLVQ